LIGHSNWWAISTKLSVENKLNIKRLFLIGSAGIRNKKSTSIKRKIYKTILSPAKVIKSLPGGKKARNIFYRLIWWHDYIKAEENPLLKKTFLNIIHTDLQETFPNIKINTTLIRWDKSTEYIYKTLLFWQKLSLNIYKYGTNNIMTPYYTYAL